METQMILFALVTFLHDLFTVVWIGGLLVFVITVLPPAWQAFGPGPQVKKLMDAIQKQQSLWVYISIAGLIITGLLQARRTADFTGLFSFANPFSAVLAVEHLVVLVMMGITLYRSLVLGRQDSSAKLSQEKLKLNLLLLNASLGVIVLLQSGFGAALAG